MLLAAVGEQPEEISRSGLPDMIGVQVGADVFALILPFGVFAVAGGAVFSEDFGASGWGIGLTGERIRAGVVFGRNFGQPRAIASSSSNTDSRKNENQKSGRQMRPRLKLIRHR